MSESPIPDDPTSISNTPLLSPSLSPQTPPPQVQNQFLPYKPSLTLSGHTRSISCVKFSPSNQFIASASSDCTIKIWNSITGVCIHTLSGHLAGVSTLSWSPDSSTLASGSDDKAIRLWDIKSGKCHGGVLRGHHHYIYCLAFSPKGNMLVSGSYDEAVILWDVRTARVMRRLPAHSDPVTGVDFVHDGTMVGSCSSDGLIRIWDTMTGQCLKTLVHENNVAVTSVRFCQNGRFVLAATLDGCLRLWNYVEGRVVKTYQGHKNGKFSLGMAFGTYNIGLEEDMVDDDDEEEDDEEREVKEGEKRVNAFVMMGDEDEKVYIWDVNTKEILQVIHAHQGTVFGVDTDKNSNTIVSGGEDGKVRLWKRDVL